MYIGANDAMQPTNKQYAFPKVMLLSYLCLPVISTAPSKDSCQIKGIIELPLFISILQSTTKMINMHS